MERRRPAGPLWNSTCKLRVSFVLDGSKIGYCMKLNFTSSSAHDVRMRSRGYLPHWERDSATYFITIRTADSISPEQIQKLKLSRYTPDEKRAATIRAVEVLLDKQPRIGPLKGDAARIVAESIVYRDGKDYDLRAWCVMPNHMHLVFQLKEGKKLAKVLHSLKSYTAHQVNLMFRSTGALWEREYFDRIVRSDQLNDFVRYVLNNPKKACLAAWPWVGENSTFDL